VNKRRRCNSRIGSPEQTLVAWPTLSLLGWECGLRCSPLTRRLPLSYWPRSWSWALIMPQTMCGAEYERTVATWQTQPQPARAFPRSLSANTQGSSWFTNRNTDTNGADSIAEGIEGRVTKNIERFTLDKSLPHRRPNCVNDRLPTSSRRRSVSRAFQRDQRRRCAPFREKAWPGPDTRHASLRFRAQIPVDAL
jgi:hypothetical protein